MVTEKNSFGSGPPVFRTKISTSLCFSAKLETLYKLDVSSSFFEVAITSQPIDFSESAIAFPIPLEPPKTIAVFITVQ